MAKEEDVLFTCPESAAISLTHIEQEEKLYYAHVGVFCEKYVVTKHFKNLLTTLNSGHRVVVLRGPKGVGKSVTLGALTAISHFPTFLCAVKSSQGWIWQQYLQKLVDHSSPSPKKATLEQGVKLNIHDVLLQQSGQHVVLVDLSTWSTASEEDQKDIASILAYITVTDNAIGVVAHSSGGGSFSVNKVAPTFETQLFSLGSYPVVTFVPFNDGEAQVFWPEGQALSLKALKPLTNYNPSLLKLCINKEDRNAAFKSVWSDVKKHTAGMMRSLCAQDAIWYESNTQLSMDILYCAANGLSMSNDRFTLYCSTWLDMEGVTYAVKDDANGVFYPKVNFPVIVQLLMEHFRNIEVPCEIHNDAVKGYRFQAHFLNNPGVLHITCKRAGGTPTLIVFDNVVPLPASEGLALDRLSLGSLVQLREKHPVIDAVGRLKDQGGKEWLVLMQVSLSKYDQHKSKVGDLYNTITWPESVSATKVDCSWLQYYRNLCNSTLDCMYVYISPKELGPDPDFVLGEKGVRSRTKELYLGLVAKGSSTAKNMSVCEVKSSRSASSVL